jgi:hypothetical protein
MSAVYPNVGAAPAVPVRMPSLRNNFAAIALENLIGRNGIKKTTMWKKYVAVGNFADARTFPTLHIPTLHVMPLITQGLSSHRGFLHPRSQTGDW